MKTTAMNSRLTRSVLACLVPAGFLLSIGTATAEMPSLDVMVNFTGNLLEEPGGNGSFMTSHLTEGADGKFYIHGYFGGAVGNLNGGTPFSQGRYGGVGYTFSVLDTNGGEYTVLSRSTTSTSKNNTGHVTYGSDGHFYGRVGGLQRWNAETESWDQLLTLSSSTTCTAPNFWVEMPNGRLYGGSQYQLCSVEKDGSDLKLLRTNVRADGVYLSNLVMHGNGRIYGLGGGGSLSTQDLAGGVVFSMLPDGSDYTKHHEFPTNVQLNSFRFSSDEQRSQLVIGDDGRLYGITKGKSGYGDTTNGLLWRMDADGQNYTVLHAFGPDAANTDGSQPKSVVLGKDGHVYGVTQGGGINNTGTIFRWHTEGEGVFQTLYTFDALTGPAVNPYVGSSSNMSENQGSNVDGKQPHSLTVARDGSIYGVASHGGSYGWGVLFRFNPGDEVPVFTFTPKLDFYVSAGTSGNNTTGNQTNLTVAQNFPVHFRWRGQNVRDCEASTDPNEAGSSWSGSRDTSFGSLSPYELTGEAYTPTTLGTRLYTLTCQSNEPAEPDPVVKSVSITVVSQTPDAEMGGRGGAFSPAMLLPLLMLGLRRRRNA